MGKPAVVHSASAPLTERAILALRPGQKKTDGASKPKAGRLIVRDARGALAAEVSMDLISA